MRIKRRFVRWQVGGQGKVKLSDKPDWLDCVIDNIGLKGAQLCLQEKLEKDKVLKLDIALSSEYVLNLEAWVVWQKAVNGHNVYGIYFTRIKDRDKEKICQFTRSSSPQDIDKQQQEQKGGDAMDDRRVFERFDARLPLRVLNLVNGQESMAQTRDLSAKGIGFISREQLAPSTALELWMDVPSGGSPLYSRGEVAWSKPISSQEYWNGINLEEANLMGMARVLKTTRI
ncbi:MAG: PilZ domain-containing protein [Candidatus Omnitrophica bacterium]|nr:PilZ domain-containing protein [Candidatus Omnitrophota bacterium]